MVTQHTDCQGAYNNCQNDEYMIELAANEEFSGEKLLIMTFVHNPSREIAVV
ncbi:hypothetical protein SDC9_187067 [bioreactor metagenome]|uniref:Uncharacterized protein n=1 Tax=bioreactor metagenome TaxID=1076179 RepID=A0A645HMR7_9ZZZZ